MLFYTDLPLFGDAEVAYLWVCQVLELLCLELFEHLNYFRATHPLLARHFPLLLLLKTPIT